MCPDLKKHYFTPIIFQRKFSFFSVFQVIFSFETFKCSIDLKPKTYAVTFNATRKLRRYNPPTISHHSFVLSFEFIVIQNQLELDYLLVRSLNQDQKDVRLFINQKLWFVATHVNSIGTAQRKQQHICFSFRHTDIGVGRCVKIVRKCTNNTHVVLLVVTTIELNVARGKYQLLSVNIDSTRNSNKLIIYNGVMLKAGAWGMC